jgi:hypothetical protein
MEAERRALGLHRVRFLCYACPARGQADIFLDLCRRPGETGRGSPGGGAVNTPAGGMTLV